MTDQTAFDLNQLTVKISEKSLLFTAVESLSFSLKPGKTLALIGESGSGKSLTALSLMRLLPDNAYVAPESSLYFENQDLFEIPEFLMQNIRGKRIAMVFQEPMTSLNPVLSIGKQLQEALPYQKFSSRSDIKKRLNFLLSEVELDPEEGFLDRYPHQLSGGQKQRIVIAMALAGSPDILIADEPTTALDVTIQKQILILLKRLQKTHGMSMLLITHDLMIAREMAHHIALMYAGQLVEFSDSEAFFLNGMHPYGFGLSEGAPSFEKRGQLLNAIKGKVPSLESKPSGCYFHTRCPYVMPICKTVKPELIDIQNHLVRCHLYPRDLPVSRPETKVLLKKRYNPANDWVLQVENLTVGYPFKKHWFRKNQTKPVVHDVSFSLSSGKTLAIMGESGSGKTTTVKALLQLLPVLSGSIHCYGEDVLSMSGHQLMNYRKTIQMVFQDPKSSLNPRMLVRDIIAEGLYANGASSGLIERTLYGLLDAVHLSKKTLNKYPHQFSGGQRQRIAIARALAVAPKILICDEPTSALDVSVQAQILNLLKELQIEKGLSYLLITHNVDVVGYVADDVVVMKSGRVVESGAVEEVLKRPKNDYTKQLVLSCKG